MINDLYPKNASKWHYEIVDGEIKKCQDIDWSKVLKTKCNSTQGGIYVFTHKEEILYIGKTHYLRNRVKKHYTKFENFEFTDFLSKNWQDVEIFMLDSRNSFEVERYYINLYKPKFNRI